MVTSDVVSFQHIRTVQMCVGRSVLKHSFSFPPPTLSRLPLSGFSLQIKTIFSFPPPTLSPLPLSCFSPQIRTIQYTFGRPGCAEGHHVVPYSHPKFSRVFGEQIRAERMRIFGRKGPSGFSASSTAEEVTKGIDGTGLTAIVTGASSGLGEETARVFSLRGVHVVMAVRNTDAGGKVREVILKENPIAKVNVMELDLGSMASVRKFALDYKSSGLPLNLLINNAGIMAPLMLTNDNIELNFGVNHLGHFLLTNLLLETMKSTARESKIEGRIVNVASGAYASSYPEGVRFDRINDESGFKRGSAYGQSKLANILHANELAKRLKEEGVDITCNSLHPGAVVTNIGRHYPLLNGLAKMLSKYLGLKNIPQGAATTCYVALHPQVKGVSGEYFDENNIGKRTALAKDEELAKKLWDFSLSLTDTK